ncbi:MAG: TlpA family protein disulfide reductase [Prevotella sp.]|nr:TlpA family protein disulfide reductase [Prevotella sp.]
MRTIIITLLALLIAPISMQAQTKVWDNVVMGYANTPMISIEKVTLAEDRTELAMRITHLKGRQMGFTSDVYLQVGSKQYAVMEATVMKLNEPYTVPADTLNFSLIFEPVPQDTKQMDFILPAGLSILNIRNADVVPEGITDTYWRNEATGDWLIGFATNHVAYNNKVWDIASKDINKDSYIYELAGGPVVKVGKLKKGKRTITIGNEKPIVCTPITTAALPDYPTKDMRKGFIDNGYKNDSVTIIGWMKDLPEQARQQGNEFEVRFRNLLMDDTQRVSAHVDAQGSFTLRFPLLNSTKVSFFMGPTYLSTVLEPGKTYFYLCDFKMGQKLFMGDDVRLQNELAAYPQEEFEISKDKKEDAMQFMARMEGIRRDQMDQLHACVSSHPNLSQRYIDYLTGCYLTRQGESMMQARYDYNHKFPKEYMDYVTTELWQKVPKPYTLYDGFSTFLRDYLEHVIKANQSVSAGGYRITLNDADKAYFLHCKQAEGKIALTDEELSVIDRFAASNLDFYTSQIQKNAEAGATTTDDIFRIDSVAFQKFLEQEHVQRYYVLMAREDIKKVMQEEWSLVDLYAIQRTLDVQGADQALHDIALARKLYWQLNSFRKSLDPVVMAYAEKEINLPAVFDFVKAVNDKYLAFEHQDLASAASLRPSSDVEGMSDGEKIFRKILEPFQGRIVYLDIWGTWCGPCKANLKESWKVKEQLKNYDIVYLYLCNGSSDESWKNVIKEYNLTGPNCVHYNLPKDQQSAIERYLNVSSFPTYKLIDKQGNIHDLHWLHHEDMKSFLDTIDKLSK